jgi:predicted nuclease of restriction endonuclease-like (RecB) superfamily
MLKINAILLDDLHALIEGARQRTAQFFSAEHTLLYWSVGTRIRTEILHEKRAEYGKFILPLISERLTAQYGSGWSTKVLRYAVQFAEIFPDAAIVHTLCGQLSWSHIRLLLPLDDDLKRQFYAQMATHEHWSVRTLQDRISSLLYERTAISKLPEQTIINDLERLKNERKMSPDLVFRDPYFLDFLGLKDTFSEQDLETAILRELQVFLIEMGNDFAFMGSQKRITIDNRDYRMDLLFFDRRLKCLVVIDLKIGEFKAAHKGQMELYLRYLERYEMAEGENPPIGLILCTGKNTEHVELLQLDKSNIRVAEYLTLLPPKELLLEKLHRAVLLAQAREQR